MISGYSLANLKTTFEMKSDLICRVCLHDGESISVLGKEQKLGMGNGENKQVAGRSLFGSWKARVRVGERLPQLQNVVQCASMTSRVKCFHLKPSDHFSISQGPGKIANAGC